MKEIKSSEIEGNRQRLFLVVQKILPRQKKNTRTIWFDTLELKQMKALCRASKLLVSGKKAELCQRLIKGELSALYTYECSSKEDDDERFVIIDRNFTRVEEDDESCEEICDGFTIEKKKKRLAAISNETLRTKCNDKGLNVSGNRYNLVLRLIQNVSGIYETENKKRCCIDGDQKEKKKQRLMKLPNVDSIGERVNRKLFPTEKLKRTNWSTSFQHTPSDCIRFVNKIIQTEVFDKNLFERGEEKLAWDVLNMLLYRITYGNVERRRRVLKKKKKKQNIVDLLSETELDLGQCRSELKSMLFPSLIRAMERTSDKEILRKGGILLWHFEERYLTKYEANDPIFTEALQKYVSKK
mmetsp:Transcript_15043/g.16677  ORF Transcript_15043/g.16677 Transcript_15043/m.16677 type:complete len:355 (+) Transcript_15043:120-1184(+)